MPAITSQTGLSVPSKTLRPSRRYFRRRLGPADQPSARRSRGASTGAHGHHSACTWKAKLAAMTTRSPLSANATITPTPRARSTARRTCSSARNTARTITTTPSRSAPTVRAIAQLHGQRLMVRQTLARARCHLRAASSRYARRRSILRGRTPAAAGGQFAIALHQQHPLGHAGPALPTRQKGGPLRRLQHHARPRRWTHQRLGDIRRRSRRRCFSTPSRPSHSATNRRSRESRTSGTKRSASTSAINTTDTRKTSASSTSTTITAPTPASPACSGRSSYFSISSPEAS